MCIECITKPANFLCFLFPIRRFLYLAEEEIPENIRGVKVFRLCNDKKLWLWYSVSVIRLGLFSEVSHHLLSFCSSIALVNIGVNIFFDDPYMLVSQILIGCSSLSHEHWKLIGWYEKIMKRIFCTLTCLNCKPSYWDDEGIFMCKFIPYHFLVSADQSHSLTDNK